MVVGDDADVAELKDAIVRKLMLPSPSSRLRLVLIQQGGTTILTGEAPLQSQGVRAGSRVGVESIPPDLATFDNVLVFPPDAAHDERLLRALVAPSNHANSKARRIHALNQLLVQHTSRLPDTLVLPLPLFCTEAHLSLLHTLVSHTQQLALGLFRGSVGPACRTLVGAQGIGKTALLRSFSVVAASAFPGVMPLYVSGAGLSSPQSSFQTACLHELAKAALATRGVRVEQRGGITAALRAHNLRLLLLVDEVDELYRVSDKQPLLQTNVLRSLGLLGSLGDGDSGRYGVLLCGSSSSTYALVCGGSPGLGEWFPLVKGGIPDLNSTKFSMALVPSSTCTAVGEVAHMLAAMAPPRRRRAAGGGGGSSNPSAAQQRQSMLPVRLLPQARLLAFFVGTSPRAIKRVLQLQNSEVDTSPFAIAAAPTLTASSKVSAQGTRLYHALLARLVLRNAALRKLVRLPNGDINLVHLMDGVESWEDVLVPLQWNDVVKVWRESAGGGLGGDDATLAQDTGLLRHLVHELTDHHLFMLRGTQFSSETLWPVTAVQVAGSEEERATWAEQVPPRVRELMKYVLPVANTNTGIQPDPSPGLAHLALQVGGAALVSGAGAAPLGIP